MKCTVEIFLDGHWLKAGFFEPDAGQLSSGVGGSGRLDYDIDYAIKYIGRPYCQVGVRYPVNFELYRESTWPAFLIDLLPSGAGLSLHMLMILKKLGRFCNGVHSDWKKCRKLCVNVESTTI